ncbi:3-oxoacyl-ACP synthase [Nocardia goodfellowii]|uniref:3-oxoacyl-[acyl-carrier-protein] synthase-3 n=1 Tax=Nocardia goodfellowii TaxID=882446 RepID=A0ABS4QCB9_9NOCA|nr:3-oxoacyl-ACP synthase [Nocardia goodfellowii]MBP2189334.1 3-oxoacyl-[acyl-carrier-protein] synthase-3 [Nocardia goodfellowii]
MITLGPVSSVFPDTAVAVAELAEMAELSAGKRAHALALGIDTVRCAAADGDHDLAAAAAARALERAGLSPDRLDALLLVGGRAPRYLMASEATRLQHRLGADRAFVAGVGELGCASISAAFTLAAGLLRGDPHCGNVLIVAAATAPTRFRYRAPMTLLGDGAGAVLLTTGKTGRYQLVDHLVRSDGKYSDLFRIDYRNLPQRDWREECADEATYSFRLAVESRKRLAAMNEELLRRNGLRLPDLGPVLMQNLSAGAFSFWEEALETRVDQACRRNLAAYGHLGSLDVLVNLEAAAPHRAPGDYTLLLNSSPVAAWSSTLLRRLPDREYEGIEL